MTSRIYTGKVTHGRRWPVKHHFSYPVYFYRFDLDELPKLDQTLPGFGYNRLALVRMDDEDFLWRGNDSLKDKVHWVLEKISFPESVQRIELVSFARYLTVIFRPVSFFLCYNAADECCLVYSTGLICQ